MNLTRLLTAVLLGATLTCTSLARDVTAAEVNGTWQSRQNTFKILALGGGKLQVAFAGVFEYKTAQGPSANTGDGAGVASIDGDTAIFRPEGAEEECKIILKFATGGKLIVTQEGFCGFGNRVTAEGTYRKISSKKPKFDE